MPSDLFDLFGSKPGYKETSREAYRSASDKVSGMQQRILTYLEAQGSTGGTDEEMDTAFNTEATRSNRPTRLMLVEAGLVRDSGDRRLTHSGSKAIVWVLTPSEEIAAQRSLMRTVQTRKDLKRRIAHLDPDQLRTLGEILDSWENDDAL